MRLLLRAASSFVVLLALTAQPRADDVGDVYDAFFRFTGSENRPLHSERSGETVDPFTGTLRIVEEDLSLPGKAGLDLRVIRSYSSRIWGRADLVDSEPMLAEKERSILGYGWTLHFGRLRNPWATGASSTCSGDFPVFEESDGTSHVFYPVYRGGTLSFVSRDYWVLDRNCPWTSDPGLCVYSNTGTRYEFAQTTDNPSGGAQLINGFFYGTTLVMPATSIVDPFENRIELAYLNQSGAPWIATDTYGRSITFSYASGEDGLRLRSINENGHEFYYYYDTIRPEQVAGHAGTYLLPGPRRFLTGVAPPAGPPTQYEYFFYAPVAENEYALSRVIHPSGGITSYGYASRPFFTGVQTVPFSVVTTKEVAIAGGTPSEWTYEYSSPAYKTYSSIDPGTGESTDLHVTTITRPDGLHDTYMMYGLGWAADHDKNGYTWAVGLTKEIARADRAEVETYRWDSRADAPITTDAVFSAPIYSTTCGRHFVADGAVYAPVATLRVLARDDAVFVEESSDFDPAGQPRMIVETGYNGAMDGPAPEAVRTTERTYFSVAKDDRGRRLNIVRGKPDWERVCVGAGCFESSWSYDEPGYPLHVETRSGVSRVFDHNLDGTLSRVTNAVGEWLGLSNYEYGVPQTLDFGGEFTIRRTVFWEGWIHTETDGRGFTTTRTYDAIGRPDTVTPPGASDVTQYTYAPDGSSVTTTRLSAVRYWKTTNLDGLARPVSTIDSEGVLTSTRYDAMGRAWFVSMPYYDDESGEVGEKLEFDGLGRTMHVTRAYRPLLDACDDPSACTVDFAYEANCVQTVVHRGVDDSTAQWSCTASFGDPGEKRLTQVLDANGSLWKYAYEAPGQLRSVTAPLGAGNRSYGYNEHWYVTSDSTAETGATSYGRNAIGQMTSMSDGRFVTVTYDHGDPLGRLRHVTYQNDAANDVTRGYDKANNLANVSSRNGGMLEYGHDELNRIGSQGWTYFGRKYSTAYHYRPDGCLERVEYPTGSVLTMSCDSANRVTSIEVDGVPIVKAVTYHSNGHVSRMTYGNGYSTVVQLDGRGRVRTIDAENAMALAYAYDGADNVLSFDNSAVPGSSRVMKYDRLDRLWTVTANNLWGFSLYQYDALGNRKVKSLATNVAYDYDEHNRLAGMSESPPRGTMTFRWNDARQLVWSSDGASYRYDGLGRRVLKSSGEQATLYHYDSAGRVIAETLPDGTTLREYFYLQGELIAARGCLSSRSAPPCTDWEWYHTDALGNVLARTDDKGAVVARIDYEPWGEEWSHSGVVGDRQYNGRVYDPGTGFHDYGARMYWPEIGRFISADSYQGDPANPASLNRYSYAQNNPYKYTDPTGHTVVPADPNAQKEYQAAKVYLHLAKADKVIQELEASPAQITIRDATAAEIATGSDFYYDSGSKTIVMNANSGLLLISGEVQTPALGILHEAGHALQDVKHPAKFHQDHNTPDSKYDDKEERRDVRKVETPAAKKLGEGTRTDHGGTPIPVQCVTCTQ